MGQHSKAESGYGSAWVAQTPQTVQAVRELGDWELFVVLGFGFGVKGLGV